MRSIGRRESAGAAGAALAFAVGDVVALSRGRRPERLTPITGAGRVTSRRATESEVDTWREHGWVLLDGLVGTEDIDRASDDLHRVFPTSEEYHADPAGVTRRWRGSRPDPTEEFEWPDDGPGFRPEQHRWMAPFPFAGTGALNRLCVHPSIVDFAERALGTPDIRLYQAHASAKYSGVTNYEQPMHIDRNHSWLPAGTEAPWWNLEGFLYLSDVGDDRQPHPVGLRPRLGPPVGGHPGGHARTWTPSSTRPSVGPAASRGSYLAYRSDVFHRGAPFDSEGTARFVLALAFKRAGQDWIGYDLTQSNSTAPEWRSFAEHSTPRELALFGFPPPGHPIWSEALLDEVAVRYPRLDLEPWRTALRTRPADGRPPRPVRRPRRSAEVGRPRVARFRSRTASTPPAPAPPSCPPRWTSRRCRTPRASTPAPRPSRRGFRAGPVGCGARRRG